MKQKSILKYFFYFKFDHFSRFQIFTQKYLQSGKVLIDFNSIKKTSLHLNNPQKSLCLKMPANPQDWPPNHHISVFPRILILPQFFSLAAYIFLEQVNVKIYFNEGKKTYVISLVLK